MKTRKYIAAYYDQETQEKLRDYCFRNSLDLSKSYGDRAINPEDFDFHTTIFYTTSRHNLDPMKLPFDSWTIPVGIELLGQEKNIPTLLVENTRMRSMRQSFESLYNMKDQWPTFKPHISLSYSFPEEEIRFAMPTFKMRTSYIEIKNLEEK